MSIRDEIIANFLTSPDFSRLPPRIRETIRRREWTNEIVLRILQLAIICLFCVIYAISPKTGPQDALTPTPFVLSGYLILSIIGLVWAFVMEPPEWSIYISIIFDFTLLYGLMVGFHIQYEQPASFILKAPALLYVFIFIAIRALRFRSRFVIAAGSAAAIGWAVVIFYVTEIDPGDNMLTRSYVEYLTANRILIGAEIDKILSILFVTAILALAVNASTNLMVTAVQEQSAAEDFSRFFDTGTARDIRSHKFDLEAGQGERREVTIMNVDIRGFSKFSTEVEAGAVMELLTAYRAWVGPILEAEGGRIDKFMGDGIMAVFGADDARSDYAAAALRASEGLMASEQAWRARVQEFGQVPALKIGIGMATGTVSWGAIGHADRIELTVIGPAANLSAKLEKHNKTLQTTCLSDAVTWELGKQQGFDGNLLGRAETARVEGVSVPIEIVAISLIDHDAAVPFNMNIGDQVT